MHLPESGDPAELLVHFLGVLGGLGGLGRVDGLAEMRSAASVEILVAEGFEIESGRVPDAPSSSINARGLGFLFPGALEVGKCLLALEVFGLKLFDFLKQKLILTQNLSGLAGNALRGRPAVCEQRLVRATTVLELCHHLLHLLGLPGLGAGVGANDVHHLARHFHQLKIPGGLTRVPRLLNSYRDVHVELVDARVDPGDGVERSQKLGPELLQLFVERLFYVLLREELVALVVPVQQVRVRVRLALPAVRPHLHRAVLEDDVSDLVLVQICLRRPRVLDLAFF